MVSCQLFAGVGAEGILSCTMQNIRKLVIVASLIVVAGIGTALFSKLREPSSEETALSSPVQVLQDSTTGLPASISYEFATSSAGDSGKISQNLVKKTVVPIPDLSRALPTALLPSAKTEMARISAELQKNPYNAALWSELGLYRKEGSDYEGARLAWEFAY